jgi:hypothetical protein
MYEQIDTSKVATAKARLRRKIILQHKRRLRNVIACHIVDSNSTIRTTPAMSATNQNKTPLADITNSYLQHPTSTKRKKKPASNNSTSSNDHKNKPPSNRRPQFPNFQVNLANKFADVTTSSSNLSNVFNPNQFLLKV